MNLARLLRLNAPFARGTFAKTFLSIYLGEDQPGLYVEKIFSINLKSFGEKIFNDKKYQNQTLKETKDLFISELTLMEKLSHPNLIPLVASRKGDYPSIIMPHAGESLNSISSNKFFADDDVNKFLIDIVSAVDYLHNEDVIHLDISPNNIFFDFAENNYRLGDLGMARKASLSELSNKFNSDIYTNAKNSPPEIIQEKKYSKESDIWMFGYCFMNILLNGSVQTWNERLFDVLESMKYDYEKLLKGKDYPLISFYIEILRSCLAKNPKDRISSTELKEKLEKEFKNQNFIPNCTIVKERNSLKILDHNFTGLISEAFKIYLVSLDEYQKVDLNKFFLLNQSILNLYPNYTTNYLFILKSLIISHLQTNIDEPNKNSKEQFSKYLNEFLKRTNDNLANYYVTSLHKELIAIKPELKKRLQYYISLLFNLINKYTLSKGFILVCDNEFDSQTGKQELKLLCILNIPDYFNKLYALNINDFSTFNFKNAVEIEDIAFMENKYSIKFKEEKQLEDVFIIVPSVLIEAQLNYIRYDNEYRNFGLYTTFNEVLNRTENINFQFKGLYKEHNLATAIKEEIKLNKSNNYLKYVQSNINNEGLLVVANKFHRINIV